MAAAHNCQLVPEAALDEEDDCKAARLKAIIAERREARRSGNRSLAADLSKQIQRETRALLRARKRGKISRIMHEFQGLRLIAGIRGNAKRKFIGSMRNSHGEICYGREEIANVFADFYAELYRLRCQEPDDVLEMEASLAQMQPVTVSEIREQLKGMANKKAADSKGIVVELLKESSDHFLELIATIFTDVLDPNAEVPAAWQETQIKVLFKKGEPTLPENYRPIAIIRALYKLFAKILCGRIKNILDDEQSCDQAGFRAGYSCDDHLFVISILSERMREFNLPLWVVAVDFQKAFDSVNHGSLWQALREQNVPNIYILMLQRLYRGQTAKIQTDVLSKDFPIERGVKQGDPISPILFNAALEKIMRKLKLKWDNRKAGVKIHDGDAGRLQCLRFADDLLLIATSKKQAADMLQDLIDEASLVGLQVHSGKTKILSNGIGPHTREKMVSLSTGDVQILAPNESTMYLGRLLNLRATQEIEINHRTSKAWAKFSVYRKELTDKHISLSDRLRLFNSVVSPTMLYGCSSWTATGSRERKIRGCQRKMLRTMLGKGRAQKKVEDNGCSKALDDQPPDTSCSGSSSQGGDTVASADEDYLESYPDWIKRVTAEVEEAMRLTGVPDWVEECRRRKWLWCGHVYRRHDGRWTRKILNWTPEAGARERGHPFRRWSDDLDAFAASILDVSENVTHEDLCVMAQDRELWQHLMQDYENHLNE